jgi:hypothetical protein
MLSAREAYKARRAAIIDKLFLLAERIQEHDVGDRINWSHVGDLSYVDGQLGELVEFLTIPADRAGE